MQFLHVFNIMCNGLHVMCQTLRSHRKFALLRRRKLSIVDESNHNTTEQESFSEQETFVQTEITPI